MEPVAEVPLAIQSSAATAKIPARWWYFWPLLLGPAGIAYAYAMATWATRVYYSTTTHEVIAIALSSLLVIVALTRWAVGRQAIFMILGTMAIIVLLREIHWDWTTKAVYGALAVVGGWVWLWRDRLAPYVDANPHFRAWLICTAVCYLLAICIARRVFRGVLPDEGTIHGDMEEVIENVSHLTFLITLLLGSWRTRSHQYQMESTPAT